MVIACTECVGISSCSSLAVIEGFRQSVSSSDQVQDWYVRLPLFLDDERDETFISSLLLRLLIELLPLAKESVRMVADHLWLTLQLLRERL